jgi:protein-tyrosine kinase
MERIREALERAKQERAARGFGALSGSPLHGGKNEDIGEITYTQTPTVDLPAAMLRESRIVSGYGHGAFTDAYKILRTQVLQRLREQGWNALAVTSPGHREGKTLTAINLAISLAQEVDQTVLLVDADLRHPSVHSHLGIKPRVGLSDYLVGDAPLADMLIHPDVGHLVVLPGGKSLSNSSEMLGSPKMAELVQELKLRYPSRIVIFDLPPVLSSADALAFSPHVDAALMVVEEARTKREEIERAAELLGSTVLLGTVLNKAVQFEKPNSAKRNFWSRLLMRRR